MNKKIYSLLLLAGAGLMILFSCKDKKEASYGYDALGSEYFPIGVGKYIVYDVDSTIWNDSTCEKLSRKYQVRHTVADSFRDDQGRRSYRVETAVLTDARDWQAGPVYYITPTESGLEYAEKELRFIKLSYPVEDGRTWFGNALIPAREDSDLGYLAGWNYRYLELGVPNRFGSLKFDNTVSVLQVNETVGNPEAADSASSRLYAREMYARGVGLVFREYIRWSYDPVKQCRQGWKVVMTAAEHN